MTKSDLNITRKRLQDQGYFDINIATLVRIKYWLRLTPAICSAWVLLGTLLHSPVILWSFVPFAFLGAFFPGNPFDMIYNYGLRHLFKGPRLPRFPRPRKFSCLMAAILVSISAWTFQSGFITPGYIIGSFSLLTGFLQVSRGVCIPSIIYGWLFGKPLACELRY